jgi:hypothetical protein
VQRRQYGDVESGGEQRGVIAVAQQMNAAADAELRGLLFYLGPKRAVAYQNEMSVRFDRRDSAGGLDKKSVAFDRLKPRYDADEFDVFAQIQLSQEGGALFGAAVFVELDAFKWTAQTVADDDYLFRRDVAAGQ